MLFQLPDEAKVNNTSQNTTNRWKIHWHLPKNILEKIINDYNENEYVFCLELDS